MDRELLDNMIPLLPSPRVLEGLGGTSAALESTPGVTLKPGIMTRPSEYVLEIGQSLSIVAGDDQGVRCAMATLQQIRSLGLAAVPAVRIHDWAAFATRAFMLDVSRDRIPTMDELRRLIRLLASLKINHFQLYFEHSFAYAGHEAVTQNLDPITPDQFRELEQICRSLGIELVAQQNCFGHLARWLEHTRYAHLAETHGLYRFNGIQRKGPMSLCPIHPGSLELVSDWIAQLRQSSSSGLLHIGCDETADIGAGHSASVVERDGLAAVYGRFVSAIAEVCRTHGFRPMFWADIALTEPAILEELPRDMLALAWGYEPDTPFARWVHTLRNAGFESWVCPGTSCWRSMTGRTSERRSNIFAAARDGIEGGATGFMLTAWGDLGHRQQWPITLRALADGAQAAWSGTPQANADAIARHVLGESSSALVEWLDRLGDVDLPLRLAEPHTDRPILLNASAMFDELHPANPALPRRGSRDEWQRLWARLGELRRSMPNARNVVIREELDHSLRRAEVAVQIALQRRGGDVDGESIASTLRNLMDEYGTLWLRRSRRAGLAASLSYDRAVLESLRTP